jgi:predicted nucleic acid-binding protein
MLRVVLDTNVLVSATISEGMSRELLRRGMAKQFSIVTADLILKELFSYKSSRIQNKQRGNQHNYSRAEKINSYEWGFTNLV